MTTCPVCETTFPAARSKLYCSTICQTKAANERTNARRTVKTPRPSLSLVGSEDPPEGQRPASREGILKALDIEWLDCWPDLHRAVAGKLNKSPPGKSIRREDALGNDREPIGHALLVDGEWIGRVRSRGVVIWSSTRQPSLEAAKLAVESQLSGRPEIVASAANLNRAAPLLLAA
jgi:hypothetical protein